MEWLYGLGTGLGWLVAFVTHVRFSRARAETLAYRAVHLGSVEALKRAEAVISLKNDQLKKLEEELDALDTPESVRARIIRVLSPPVS